ncbi:hypothetical protein [Caballeronia concitans]|uniref:Polymer-forming cytoskeletal n=1 Tax=Caballeronia concitans TaxID=1777133 RepID=A0A658QQ97_9BURK|nr:hypothetical protein [Caballeronia concitans]KIG02775.1 hypothetical protein BurMR1_1064 [Burkholderia sp. MR1]SAL09554.1 hypothetical protein AWB72_00135 [Caballeronia concitans]
MASVTINGRTVTGKNISIRGKQVTVDGEVVSGDSSPSVTIEIYGDVEKIDVDACGKLTVHGQAGVVSTVSGNVYCGDVGGSVHTVSGNVACRDVGGNVSTTSGSIRRG